MHDCSIYLKNVFQSFLVRPRIEGSYILLATWKRYYLFNFFVCILFFHFCSVFLSFSPHIWMMFLLKPSCAYDHLWAEWERVKNTHIFPMNSYRVRPIFEAIYLNTRQTWMKSMYHGQLRKHAPPFKNEFLQQTSFFFTYNIFHTSNQFRCIETNLHHTNAAFRI